MNRTGLLIALGIAAVTGIVFAIWPQLDLAISGLFYDTVTRRWHPLDGHLGVPVSYTHLTLPTILRV